MSEPVVSRKPAPALIRILLVEDNPADAVLLREVLKDATAAQFRLTWVKSRTEALERLTQDRFDVMLLDLGLPESTGLDTFNHMHAQAPNIPTIVLSGLSDEDVAVATVQGGAQDYLVKGRVDSELLVRAMRYAIERKRTEVELRRRNEEIQEDLNMAREFQLAFLPRKYPVFPRGASPEQSKLRFHHRYQPSSSVGGDFFHILQLSDTQAGVFICDVMGHGVRSALVTALMRGLVEEHARAATEPGRFLAEVNKSLAAVLRQTGTTLFATAFYMVVDIAASHICYAAAGHPSPLVLHRRAGTAERIYEGHEPTGAVLGLVDSTQYETTEKPFAPGDTVLLYTDGVREVANANEEEFGLKRLVETVRQRLQSQPGKLMEELMQEALRYSGATTFDDDVCLVAVDWPEPGAPMGS